MKKQHAQVTEYSDERFIAQLGIVSVQSRIDAEHPLNLRTDGVLDLWWGFF